jgi:hypothetical protein
MGRFVLDVGFDLPVDPYQKDLLVGDWVRVSGTLEARL